MRFRVNRALVGDSQEWPLTGYGSSLGLDSTEILVPDTFEPWEPNEPHETVPTADWDPSLRCLTFTDDHTKQVLNTYALEQEEKFTTRPFDVMSRTFVCE